jgi:hypothetical protein
MLGRVSTGYVSSEHTYERCRRGSNNRGSPIGLAKRADEAEGLYKKLPKDEVANNQACRSNSVSTIKTASPTGES